VLSNSGLTAATTYYIYAYDNAGTLALEASTTGHATDTTVGHEVKSGDATRLLVGMVHMGAGSPGTFVDSATQRFLANWFNRRTKSGSARLTADTSTASTSRVELATELRIEFLSWGDEAAIFAASGFGRNDTAGASNFSSVTTDGVTAFQTGEVLARSPAANDTTGWAVLGSGVVSEGYHYATLAVRVSSGTGLWRGQTNGTNPMLTSTAIAVRI
jgi:hypothetical protein